MGLPIGAFHWGYIGASYGALRCYHDRAAWAPFKIPSYFTLKNFLGKFEPGVDPWVGVVSIYGKKWYGVGLCRMVSKNNG
ncbi:hypothetical protein QCM8_16 [Bacillus phage QCM8]|nr:hypothetical protein QCM8_16 [Bacillus phage QCM8]